MVSSVPARVRACPRRLALCRVGHRYRPARDKTIVVFDCGGTVRTPRLVADRELSPLDLTVAPNGHLVVSSEHPFGAPDAVSSIREYERLSGRLVRVFVPDSSLWSRRLRGLRYGPDGRLYCVGQDHVVAFDFVSSRCLGPAVQLSRLNGQALVWLAGEEAESRLSSRRMASRSRSHSLVDPVSDQPAVAGYEARRPRIIPTWMSNQYAAWFGLR